MVKELAGHSTVIVHAAMATALLAAALWAVAWTRARELHAIAPVWVLVGSAVVAGMLATVVPAGASITMAAPLAALFVNAGTDVKLGRIVNWVVVVGVGASLAVAFVTGAEWRVFAGGAFTFGTLTALNVACGLRLYPSGDVKAAAFVGLMLGAWPGLAAAALALVLVTALMLLRKSRNITPLAPFYLVAAIVVLAVEQTLGTGIG